MLFHLVVIFYSSDITY